MADYIYYNGELYHAKYIKKDRVNGKWRYYYDHNDGDGWSNKTGIQIGKNKDGISISAFNTKADRYWRKKQKTKTNTYGALKVEQAEDGTTATLNISTKKIKSVSKKMIDRGRNIVDKWFKRKK